jgi:hypothetical protein
VSRVKRHLSYANVCATLALFLALTTGAVYAADKIGSRQIENNSIKSQDIRDGKVKGRDVKRKALGAREVKEESLDGSKLVALEGEQFSDCDPVADSYTNCAEVTVELQSRSALLATATGGFSSEGEGARATCQVQVDGLSTTNAESPGEVEDNTDDLATDGFARTLVLDALGRGAHTVALACTQLGMADARIRQPTIAVLAVRAP